MTFTPQYEAPELGSPDTFDSHVAKGILPAPKRRGKLTRWKWSEIVSALEGGNASVVQLVADEYERGVDLAKASHA